MEWNSNLIRVKILKSDQNRLFRKINTTFEKKAEITKILEISPKNYNNYASSRTRYVPKIIIEKICKILLCEFPRIIEEKSLKEIRQETIKKTYPILKKKYGKNWIRVIYHKGHIALKKKYGKDWGKIIGKKGQKISRDKYGKDFQKVFWGKAINSLENKYGKDWSKVVGKKGLLAQKNKLGKNWAKIVMKNARKGQIKKYGSNWAKVISKKGARILKKKYGSHYLEILGKRGILKANKKLTKQEKQICYSLIIRNIPYETHCIKENKEYDIIIPNLKDPQIIIECTEGNLTVPNAYTKIMQLIGQKEAFPNKVHIFVTKKNKNCNSFNPAIYDFFRDRDIIVFWDNDIEKMSGMIEEYIFNKSERVLDYKYDLNSERKRYNQLSYYGALSQKNKETASEYKLDLILKKISSNYEKQYIYKTIYNNFLAIDFYEKLGSSKIFYEITTAKSVTALRSLAGKLVFLKNLDPSLKLVVILTKIKRKNNTREHEIIFKYADIVLLSKDFNEKNLIYARSQITNSTKNSS